MGILNNNDYRRGFADGKKDAESGKDPNYIRMGLSGKFVIHGSAALDSYARGYNDGYRETMRKSIVQKVEVVNKPANTSINHQITSGNMDNIQRLEIQIDALRKLEHLQLETIEELNSRMQMFDDRASSLLEDGLPVEIMDKYQENYLQPAKQKIRSITDEMQDADLKYIRETISRLEDLMDRIMSD